jgi:diphthine methyl ester acylhydrolase
LSTSWRSEGQEEATPSSSLIKLTTSYDNAVRLFDVRKPLIPLTQADVGGGAWRVKWHPSEHRKNDLLVACMHDGFKILKFDVEQLIGDGVEYTIVKRFDEHDSLAYGADWSFSGDHREGTLVASCSFYDHTLYLWRG